LKDNFVLENEMTVNPLEIFEVEDIQTYIEEAVKLSVN
jgi:hypothetical protein